MLPMRQRIIFSIVVVAIDLVVISPLLWWRVTGWGFPSYGIFFVDILLVWLLYMGIFGVFFRGSIGQHVTKRVWEATGLSS